mmetsp:Transcript_90611/g.261131  ORF Transcript_90611/g.261131 Transcript_90611/m.261131 type:complete len:285 (-) Transcript_90611:380-1234(-)
MGNLPKHMLLTMITLLLTKCRPFLSTAISVMPMTSSTTSMMLTGLMSMASGPASSSLSDFAISMMLVTRSRSRPAQPLIMLKCRFCEGFEVLSNKDALKPMMPWRGLRNSWPRTAVIRVFRSCVAFIAATSVRSCPIAVMAQPSESPSCTMRLMSIFTGRPSVLQPDNEISTALELEPLRHASIADWTLLTQLSGTKSKMLCPTASRSRMPETCAKRSFQACTKPSGVMVKIGALARRNKRYMSSLPASTLRSSAVRSNVMSSQFRTTTSTDAWTTFRKMSPVV